MVPLGAILVLVLLVIIPGIRIINQYERGVVLRLGKYSRTLNPGFRVILPYLDKMIKVDVRTTPMDIPKQEVITRDNVTVNVDAVVYARVMRRRPCWRQRTISMQRVLLRRQHSGM